MCHYISALRPLWCTKKDWSRILFFSDIDMHLFIKTEIHVGMSYIAHKYNRLNKICRNDYNENKKIKSLIYVDTSKP